MQTLTVPHLGVEAGASAASGSCCSVFATMMWCIFKPWARINPLPLKRLLSGCFISAGRETKKLVLSAPSLCDLGPSIPSPHAEVTSQHTHTHSSRHLLEEHWMPQVSKVVWWLETSCFLSLLTKIKVTEIPPSWSPPRYWTGHLNPMSWGTRVLPCLVSCTTLRHIAGLGLGLSCSQGLRTRELPVMPLWIHFTSDSKIRLSE